MSMDVFDEFEMKPLTDGLGFHQKKEQINTAFNEVDAIEKGDLLSTPKKEVKTKSVDRASQALDKLMDSLNTLDKQGITFTDTLPKNEEPVKSITARSLNKDLETLEVLKQPSIHPVMPTKDQTPADDTPPEKQEALRKVENEKIQDEINNSLAAGTRRGSSDSLVGNLKEMSVSIPAAILDAIVVLSLSQIFLVAMLFVTETSLDTLVYSLTQDLMTQISAVMLFVVVLQIYVVVSRSLFGCTLGEWTFDCQMGKDEQVKQGYYPIQNIWRSLLMIGTGIVVLPFFSLLFRKDLARYLTGLQLYRRV